MIISSPIKHNGYVKFYFPKISISTNNSLGMCNEITLYGEKYRKFL